MRSLPFTGGDEELRQELEKLADPGYKTFHEGLIPGASMSYGVRCRICAPWLRRCCGGTRWAF